MGRRKSRRRKSYLNLGGHPIHALAVPVPIGLYVAAFVTALIALRRPKDPFWTRASRLSGAAAAGSSTLAAVAGLVDFLTLVRTSSARKVGIAHMTLNSLALGLQVYALLRGRRNRRSHAWMQSAVIALVSAAGFAGGDLTYRHRIGVFGRRKRPRPQDR